MPNSFFTSFFFSIYHFTSIFDTATLSLDAGLHTARLAGIQVGEVVGGNLPPHALANPLDIRNRRCVFPQDNHGRPHPSLLRPHPSFLKPHQVS